MMFIPYSTALSLARPPYVTYAVAVLCAVVFTLQTGSSITASLMYYPGTWNPLKMVTAALAHANFLHLFGNLVFFLAFAPAVEILIGSWRRYLGAMLFVALVAGVSYSVSTLIGSSEALPTLGLSGVVTGMMGLSAYLMPHARIRVFCWFFLFWKTVFVPAWIIALIYIGLDAWKMIGSDDFGGINLVAHVFGGAGGYLYGLIWLKQRREETREELAEEIEAMGLEQRYGKTRAQAHRYKRAMEPIVESRTRDQEFDRFMALIYQKVTTNRDSDAVVALLERYGSETPYTELETVFERFLEWGPSRATLCLGRLIIEILDREQRHGKVLMLIEQCQAISPKFVLPDLTRTLFFAQMALDTGKPEIARNLTYDAVARYGRLVDAEQANHLCQQARRMMPQK